VVDVLRASTTMIYALAAGATGIVTCLAVNEARELAAEMDGPVVVGGERGGLPIESFDFGNSPAEYTPESVGGKTLVLTTTNGTRALSVCHEANRVVIAAFVNLRAVTRELAAEPVVHILCAGTDGEVTREDVLLAGALAERLLDQRGAGAASEVELNDTARLALEAWLNVSRSMRSARDLARELRRSQGGRNLMAIGAQADIELAADVDRFDLVPQRDRQTGRIVC
jgi:2-phosphosulfolactate phosphatase